MLKNIFYVLIFVSVFFSCKKENFYHHSERIPSEGWEMGKSYHFEDSLKTDAPEVFKLILNLRHNPNYPYRNLWLYLRTSTSDGLVRLDTINWTIADKNGHLLGSGWGSLYSLSYILPDLAIEDKSSTRWFKIDIQNGLKDKYLKGIEDIGVRLSKNN